MKTRPLLNKQKYKYFILGSLLISIFLACLSAYLCIHHFDKSISSVVGFIIGRSLYSFMFAGLLPIITIISCVFRRKPVKENIIDKFMFYLSSVGLGMMIVLASHSIYVNSKIHRMTLLEQTSVKENKLLPKKIDHITTLMRTFISNGLMSYVFNLDLSKMTTEQLYDIKTDKKSLYHTVKHRYCGELKEAEAIYGKEIYYSPEFSYNYIYKDTNNKVLTKFSLYPKDCT